MKNIVRDSKFRHVHAEPSKYKIEDIRLATKPTECSGIKGNSKFVALPWGSGGGGAVAVLNVEKTGRLPHAPPLVSGHQGGVLDFEFDPFSDYQILTASEDTNARIFSLPEGGLTTHINEADVTMKHTKKVHLATYHPTANKVIATASYDLSIRIWDATEESELFSMELPELSSALKWDYDGSRLAVPCKDKILRILDPRDNKIVCSQKIHDGTKSNKVVWCGDDTHKLITTGFSYSADRQVAIWDLRKFGDDADALHEHQLDQGTGALFPTYDPDTGILFLVGKGDGNVRYFEVTNQAPYMHFIDVYSSTRPQKGFDFIPKHALDVSRHEIMRGLKLEASSVEMISFFVPRKSTEYQEDIYPDTYAGIPQMSGEAWFGGETKPPAKKSMAPGASAVKSRQSVLSEPAKTAKQVRQELEDANLLVAQLQEENRQLKEEIAQLKR